MHAFGIKIDALTLKWAIQIVILECIWKCSQNELKILFGKKKF